MAEPAEDPDDVSTHSNEPSTSKVPNKRNAFTELMAPKPKSAKSDSKSSSSLTGNLAMMKKGTWRGALLDYIEQPEKFPGQVLRVTPNTVLIKDLFPKATVHLLLLPRSSTHYNLHPHEAFQDEAFLSTIKEEAASAAKLAAAELSRQVSSFSATSKARNEAMDALTPEEELPPGRDYLSEIRIGVHAHPSMSHLHVHIISRDMHSEKVKHRKHYNSFNTPFFIPVEDYPLAEDDVRRKTSFQNANLERDFVCWRCGKEFKSRKFAELKKHLEIEFELWKKE